MNDTTFVKEKKIKDYSVIDNTFLRDDSLSMSAKGLFAYFLFLPDDWVIYQSELANHFSNGRDAIRNATKELEAHGYLEKEPKKDEKNRFAGYKYIIHEKPIAPKKTAEKTEKSRASFPAAGFPFAGKPKTENPVSGNPPLPITDNILNTNKPNTALNSFADAHEFKDADACTPAEPQTPPSKAVCQSLPRTEDSPDDIMNSGTPRFFNISPAHTETLDIFREQEETMHPAGDLNSSEDRQAASEETGPLNLESSGTHSAAGGFPFADEAKPERAKKVSPRKKSPRKTLSDEELDGHFAALDSETVRRMHGITETLYKKARIADPLYVRSGNFLRNQTKKLTDFLSSSGRTADEAESVFNFGFTDSFWCNVVVSVDIFIRNYTKILQKMRERRPAQQSAVKRESAFESAGIGRGDYREEW